LPTAGRLRKTMISLTKNRNGEWQVSQWEISPTIYLDHWALRKFSEDQTLATRFTAALNLRNGTLALSWLNLAEFTKVTIAEQAHKAENLVEAILPRLFFLEIYPFKVIQRENEALAGGSPTLPHADIEFLKAFSQFRPTSLNLFTAHDLFGVIQASTLGKNFSDLGNALIKSLEALRNRTDTDPRFQSTLRRSPSGFQIQRGTRFILHELVRTFLINKQIKITTNQAIDLLHATVPVAYCDLVLLDKHWETQVDYVRSRLNARRIPVPIARVFSSKANGVDRFLCELESN